MTKKGKMDFHLCTKLSKTGDHYSNLIAKLVKQELSK